MFGQEKAKPPEPADLHEAAQETDVTSHPLNEKKSNSDDASTILTEDLF